MPDQEKIRNSKPRILIFGGTGFLGEACADYLSKKGYEISIVSRGQAKSQYHKIIWDGENLDNWANELEGAHAVINFSGKSINCVHTERNRAGILESRIQSVSVLNRAILKCKNPPPIFIQSGSLARFNNAGHQCHEHSEKGTGFTADVSLAWENAFYQTQLPNTRKVMMRIGIVLGRDGGAFTSLLRPVKLFVGGAAGDGNQVLSWIHKTDFLRIIDFTITQETLEGSLNICNPNPCSNSELMSALRKAANRPWSPSAPKWLVRLVATYILKTDPSLALDSINCIPKKITEKGFRFEFENIQDACRDLLNPKN